MYEKILLESGKVFRGRCVSSIGANVVDDTEIVTIPVFIPEGVAEIVSVDAPSSFTPGVAFDISVVIRNVGTYADTLFIRFSDNDTGTVYGFTTVDVEPGASAPFTITITLVQETNFNCLIEAGHVED